MAIYPRLLTSPSHSATEDALLRCAKVGKRKVAAMCVCSSAVLPTVGCKSYSALKPVAIPLFSLLCFSIHMLSRHVRRLPSPSPPSASCIFPSYTFTCLSLSLSLETPLLALSIYFPFFDAHDAAAHYHSVSGRSGVRRSVEALLFSPTPLPSPLSHITAAQLFVCASLLECSEAVVLERLFPKQAHLLSPSKSVAEDTTISVSPYPLDCSPPHRLVEPRTQTHQYSHMHTS